MRSVMLVCGAFSAGVTSSAVGAAERPGKVRMVQVISMSSAMTVPRSGKADVAPDATQEARPAVLAALSDAFRTHDLSRRWVSFEMASSFASNGEPASALADPERDPFARVGVAQLGPVLRHAGVPSPSPVAIPSWMRRGLAFSAVATSLVPGCAARRYNPSGFLNPDSEARRLGYYAMMSTIACEYRIPVGLFDAMIIRESGYKAGAYSYKKAYGLTQLMPETAAGLGVNRYDVEQNLRGGARYLRQQLDSFGQVHLALAAYNAGPGRVRNGMVPRIAETQAYVDNVLLNWRRLAGLSRVATVQTSRPAMPMPQPIGRMATVSSY